MAYTILSESYGRRLPKITAEADSTEDLTALGTDYAEGSTCNVDGTEYTLDKVSGWIVPGGGGGGSLPFDVFVVGWTIPEASQHFLTKTAGEIIEAANSGALVMLHMDGWRAAGDGLQPWGVVKSIIPPADEYSYYWFTFTNYDYSFYCSGLNDYPAEDMG